MSLLQSTVGLDFSLTKEGDSHEILPHAGLGRNGKGCVEKRSACDKLENEWSGRCKHFH